MAMNKKERELFEAAMTAAALRTTADVFPDVPPPSSGADKLSVGWIPSGGGAAEACSSCVHHGVGSQTRTSSQGSRWLYSSKLLALRARRRGKEKEFAAELRHIDKQIEAEESKS